MVWVASEIFEDGLHAKLETKLVRPKILLHKFFEKFFAQQPDNRWPISHFLELLSNLKLCFVQFECHRSLFREDRISIFSFHVLSVCIIIPNH